jgi:hypothetical protein
MYDEMMAALLRIVLRPPHLSPAVVSTDDAASSSASGACASASPPDAGDGMWDTVRQPSNTVAPGQGSSSFKNLLKWKAFSRANRENILAEFAGIGHK